MLPTCTTLPPQKAAVRPRRRRLLAAGAVAPAACLAIAACLTSYGGYPGPGPGPGLDQGQPVDGGGANDLLPADAAVSGDLRDGGGDLASAAKDLAPDLGSAVDAPFDPASCSTPALTAAQALSLLGAAPRLVLADATLYRRTRSCTGMTPATCGAWSTPVVHDQLLLTYSGGVTTDYKSFTFPTHLILFAQAGQPKLSIRHESDYRHTGTTDSRGVLFSFGADPMVNSYPIIYVWDFAPKPSRYEDLQGLLGDDGFLHAAEHCARVVFPIGLTTEIAALYRY